MGNQPEDHLAGRFVLELGALRLAEAAEAVCEAQLEAEAALRGAVGGGEGALGVAGGVAPPPHARQHAAAAVEGGRGGAALGQQPRERPRRLQPLTARQRRRPRRLQLGAHDAVRGRLCAQLP